MSTSTTSHTHTQTHTHTHTHTISEPVGSRKDNYRIRFEDGRERNTSEDKLTVTCGGQEGDARMDRDGSNEEGTIGLPWSPLNGLELLSEINNSQGQTAASYPQAATPVRELAKAEMVRRGGVVTFRINATEQALEYSCSFDSIDQLKMTDTHLVFQRKDGRLSRLARCRDCRDWHPWTDIVEERFRTSFRENEIFRNSKACEQDCTCNQHVKMLFCETCPWYHCGYSHFKTETNKHAEKGRDKDEQWCAFRELLTEDSRDKALTTVVDKLFRAVYGADADIFLDGMGSPHRRP